MFTALNCCFQGDILLRLKKPTFAEVFMDEMRDGICSKVTRGGKNGSNKIDHGRTTVETG